VIISNAALRGRNGTWDIHMDDGKFSSIVASSADSGGREGSSDAELFDAGGRLVVEPFVDAHVHLDYANTVGRPRSNESGTLFEGIRIWAERKEQGLNSFDEIYRSALAATRSEAANGTGFIRSQVDVTDPDLTGLKAILQLRDDVEDWMEIQVVASRRTPSCPSPTGRDWWSGHSRWGPTSSAGSRTPRPPVKTAWPH
jgi:cytosine/creatinine deaminase